MLLKMSSLALCFPLLLPAQQALPPGSATAVPERTVNSSARQNLLDAGDQDAVTTIRKRVDEVNVVFTVTDKRGRFKRDLSKNDFQILDNRKPPAAVVDFRTETDLPLRVGLLVDVSGSIRDRFHFEQETAIQFLNQVIRPHYDRAFVLGFDTTAEMTQDFTDNPELLARGVHVLRPGGGTALYDAVFYSCRDKLMKAQASGPVRRAIILISDGEDNQSRVEREDAIAMCQRAETIIYSISTNTSNTRTRGDKVLERFAEQTAGRAFFPFKVQEMANAFRDIQDELRSQYAIAYKPSDFVADGSYRSIDIAVLNRRDFHVRARKGYYAPSH